MASKIYWRYWSKRILILLIGLGFLALPGCVQNTEDLTRADLFATGLDYNEKIPLNDDFDTCLGERVTITGIQHIVGRFRQDSQGRLHFGFTRNTHGTGFGQVSGDKYLFTDTVNTTSFEVIAGEPKVFVERYTAHLMRVRGNTANDDALLHFLSRIVVDANGHVTSSIEREKFDCK
jgi:hypothetical protein